MSFKTRYTTESLKTISPETEREKIVINNDAYAQCEMLELLINTMRNK